MPSESTAPPAPAAPVAVVPIPASQSKTLRWARLTTILTTVFGFLPDVLEFVLNLISIDPKFAAAVEALFPRPIRYIAMAALIGCAQQFRRLRNATSAPIIGTQAERNAPTLTTTSDLRAGVEGETGGGPLARTEF